MGLCNLKRIREFFLKYKNLLVYLVVGGLTTFVNFLVYFPLYNWLSFSATVSNTIAWGIAVIFAFFTNKRFVFHSDDWSTKVVVSESSKFVGCRLLSGLIETVPIWFLVDFLEFNGNTVKIIVSVFVVIFNYFFSKWFVFRNRKN